MTLRQEACLPIVRVGPVAPGIRPIERSEIKQPESRTVGAEEECAGDESCRIAHQVEGEVCPSTHIGAIHDLPAVGHSRRCPEGVGAGHCARQVHLEDRVGRRQTSSAENQRHGEIRIAGRVVGRALEEAPEIGPRIDKIQVPIDRKAGIEARSQCALIDRHPAGGDGAASGKSAS